MDGIFSGCRSVCHTSLKDKNAFGICTIGKKKSVLLHLSHVLHHAVTICGAFIEPPLQFVDVYHIYCFDCDNFVLFGSIALFECSFRV